MHLQIMQSVMMLRRRDDDVPAFGVGRRMMMVKAGTLAEGEENGGGGGVVHLYSLLLPLLACEARDRAIEASEAKPNKNNEVMRWARHFAS